MPAWSLFSFNTDIIRPLLFGGLAGVLVLVLLHARQHRRTLQLAFVGAFLLSIVLHWSFIHSYPATNDEGSILADVLISRQGLWPFKDAGGAKGPLALLILAPFVLAAKDPLLTGRILVSVFTAVEAVLLGLLAKRLWGDRAGVLAALLYAGTPAVVAQTTQVFLQPFALPFATAALILLVRGEKKEMGKRAVVAGVLFSLAFLARFTALAFAPVGLLLIATWRDCSWRARRRSALSVAAGFLLTLGAAVALLAPFLDTQKMLDALGWQGVVVGQQRAMRGQAAAGLTIIRELARGIHLPTVSQLALPLLRGALPLLACAAAFLVIWVGRLLRLPRVIPAATLFVLATGLPALLAGADLAPALSDARLPLVRGTQLLLGISGLLALRRESLVRTPGRDVVLLGSSFLFLALGYANYGRFRGHYHAEFLVLYVLAAAAVLAEFLSPRRFGTRGLAVLLLFVVVGALLGLSFPNALLHPHAGNIPLDTVRQVAAEVRRRTPPGGEVFTAQVLFPAVAGRSIPFGITHPGWYREEAFGVLPTEIRVRYYPDRAALRAHLLDARVPLIVVERRTQEVFLEFDPELRALIDRRYQRVRVIENPLLGPVEFWEYRGERTAPPG